MIESDQRQGNGHFGMVVREASWGDDIPTETSMTGAGCP